MTGGTAMATAATLGDRDNAKLQLLAYLGSLGEFKHTLELFVIYVRPREAKIII